MRQAIIITILFCFIGYTNAQNKQLLIKICDKKTHEILPLSTVYNYNLKTGTISDDDDYTFFGVSPEEIKDVNQSIYQSELYQLSIYYLLEKIFDNTNNQSIFSAKTLFNKHRSCYFLNKDILSLLTINLYLDVYRKNNLELNRKLKNITNQKSAIKLVDQYYKKAKLEAKMLFQDLNDLKNVERLIEKNEKMEHLLQKDNIKNIIASNTNDVHLNKQDNINILFRIAETYEQKYQYDKAIYFYKYFLENRTITLDKKTENFIKMRLFNLQKKAK